MREKIYYFNKGTKTLHIKGFCKNSDPYEKIGYCTEQEAFKDNVTEDLFICVKSAKKKKKKLFSTK